MDLRALSPPPTALPGSHRLSVHVVAYINRCADCHQCTRDEEADTSTPDGGGGGEDPSDDSPDIPEL